MKHSAERSEAYVLFISSKAGEEEKMINTVKITEKPWPKLKSVAGKKKRAKSKKSVFVKPNFAIYHDELGDMPDQALHDIAFNICEIRKQLVFLKRIPVQGTIALDIKDGQCQVSGYLKIYSNCPHCREKYRLMVNSTLEKIIWSALFIICFHPTLPRIEIIYHQHLRFKS